MGRGVAVEPLELQADVDQPRHRLVLAAHLLQARLAVDGLLQADRVGRVVGDQLADPVDLRIGHLQDAADVADHGAGLQLSEGDDLGDPVQAVALLDVVQDLVPIVLAEVDVEVRHRHAVGIEETLEQQAPAQRVEVGDGQGPGDHRSGARAAPRADRYALLLGPLDELGDDQEVAREAHLLDDAELVGQALTIGSGLPLSLVAVALGIPGQLLEARLQAGLGLGAQLLGLAAAFGGRIGRQDRAALLGEPGAAPGDDQRVVDGFGQVGEERTHLLGRLEAMFRRQAATIGLADVGALGDAEQRIVRLVERVVGEVDVVGRDQRQLAAIGQLDQRGLQLGLAFEAVALQLDVEPAVEDLGQTAQQGLGERALRFVDQSSDGTAGTAGQRDQALVVGGQHVEIDLGRLARIALQEGAADQPQQTAVADLVLGQQHQLVGRRPDAVARLGAPALAVPPQRDLAADDRLNAGFGREAGELQGTEEIAAVGHGDRGHLLGPAKLDQGLELDRAFRQRIGGMDPQMDEIGVGHGLRIPRLDRVCQPVAAGLSTVVQAAMTLPSSRRRVRSMRSARAMLWVATRAASLAP